VRAWTMLACTIGSVFASSVSAAENAVVVNPHIRTDTSVDFRTVESILAGVVRDGMTGEQKVLAVFHLVRRMMVHGPCPDHLAFDFHKVMHVLGTGSCLRQTTPLAMLLGQLGYKSQSWVHDGHHMMQVFYGGAWHCLDPHMTFYVYDRSDPPKIASLQQLQDDPTLAYKAVEEGRAGKGFLLCGDSPKWFAGKEGHWALEFDGDWPDLKIDEPFGRIMLRRGETYVRTWRPGKYWYKAAWLKSETGPVHTCGTADRKDEVNLPLYEPHVWRGPNNRYYRCWGVGRLEYKPDLASGHYTDAVVRQHNVGTQKREGVGVLTQADSGKPAEVVFRVNCPYVITAGELTVAPSGGGTVSAAVSIDRGKTWQPVALACADGELQAVFIDEVNGSFDGYWLKLDVSGGAAIAGLELISHFQLNRFSLPHFVPGKNTVFVTAEQYGSPLAVTYRWAEGRNWLTERSITRTFAADGRFEVDVAGPKYPRMEHLSLSVAP